MPPANFQFSETKMDPRVNKPYTDTDMKSTAGRIIVLYSSSSTYWYRTSSTEGTKYYSRDFLLDEKIRTLLASP